MHKEKFKNAYGFISGICLLAIPLFYSCGFDSGLEVPGPLPLGKFYGKAAGSWPSEYRNPRVAIVWQSLTGSISIWDIGSTVIDSSQPGRISFAADLSHLPKDSISTDTSQYVIG